VIAAPIALWGLVAIPLLVLLSFWRMKPARVTVPSVALWKRLPANIPPVRSLRKPTWSIVLLLQILAVVAGVGALAKPVRLESRPQPRRIAVVVDLGARAFLDRINAELDRIAAETAGDDVVMFETPVLKRGPLSRAGSKVDYIGDPAAAIALAKGEGRTVIFVGDRPAAADVVVLTGAPSQNIGIVDFVPEKDRFWVKLLNLGAARAVKVRVDDHEETWTIDAGESSRRTAGSRLELPDDGFALDNVAVATKTMPIDVELRGDEHALLRWAIQVQPGARIVDRGGALVVSVGKEAPEPCVVIAPPRGATFKPATFSLADGHPLARGTRAEHWQLEDVAELAGYDPIVFADGKCVVGRRGGRIVINGGLGSLPHHPSFSIFFANVLESHQSASQGWVVRRTGPSQPRATDGACVLDGSASSLGTESRPFRTESLGAARIGEVRTDLSAWVAAAAVILMLGAWLMESRSA